MSKLLIQLGGQQQHGIFHSESSETKPALIQKIHILACTIFLCVAIIEELIRKKGFILHTFRATAAV